MQKTPVWLKPDDSLFRLAGQRLRIRDKDGRVFDGLMTLSLSQTGPLQFGIKFTDGIIRYMTQEAIRMLQLNEGKDGPEYLLVFEG